MSRIRLFVIGSLLWTVIAGPVSAQTRVAFGLSNPFQVQTSSMSLVAGIAFGLSNVFSLTTANAQSQPIPKTTAFGLSNAFALNTTSNPQPPSSTPQNTAFGLSNEFALNTFDTSPGFNINFSDSSLSFGNTQVEAASQKTLTIGNTGNATLTVSGIVSSNEVFKASPTTLAVAPGDSQKVTVTFTPSAPGAVSGVLTVTSDDPNKQTVRIILNGNGTVPVTPKIKVFPTLINFGTMVLGQTKSATIEISNTGGGTLRVANIVLSNPDFSIEAIAFSLGTGEKKALIIKFSPTKAVNINETLYISSDDQDAKLVRVPLRATAFDTAEVASPVSLDLSVAEGDQGRKERNGIKSGSTVPVQIFVKDAPAIFGYIVRLVFDSEMLNLKDFTPSDFIPDRLQLTPTLISPDTLDVRSGNLTGATRSGDGLLGTITFQVTDRFSQESYIAATQVIFSLPGGRPQEIKQRFIVKLVEGGKDVSPDFNGDGFVDSTDFFIFAAAFGKPNTEIDLTGDGFVDFNDFFIFAAAFGQKTSKPAAKPVDYDGQAR